MKFSQPDCEWVSPRKLVGGDVFYLPDSPGFLLCLRGQEPGPEADPVTIVLANLGASHSDTVPGWFYANAKHADAVARIAGAVITPRPHDTDGGLAKPVGESRHGSLVLDKEGGAHLAIRLPGHDTTFFNIETGQGGKHPAMLVAFDDWDIVVPATPTSPMRVLGSFVRPKPA